MSAPMNITEEEQYDRQIRLWGIDAQRRMQTARVLLHGLSGLHVEVCKNLVLSGVNVTIQDPAVVSESDLSSNYFLTEEDIGENRASAALSRIQALNSFADVCAGDLSIGQLSQEYINSFQAVLVAECTESEAIEMSAKCRHAQAPFFWSSSFGLEGCFFVDLGTGYCCKDENKKEDLLLEYPTLQSALSMKLSKLKTKKLEISLTYFKFRVFEIFRSSHSRLPDPADGDTLRDIADKLLVSSDLAPTYFDSTSLQIPPTWSCFLPTCSVLGGILGQEIIKVTTRVGTPVKNFFVYSAQDFCGRSFLLENSEQ